MTKLTEKIASQICIYRQHGLSKKSCASMVGIDESTLYRWLKKGENSKKGKYRAFFMLFCKADAEFEAIHLDKIFQDKSWQSSAWLLERTKSERYGRKDKVSAELDHKGEVKLKPLNERMSQYEDYFNDLDKQGESTINNNSP